MSPRNTRCPYCRVVKFICYWGPRPEAPRKRSIVTACGILALAILSLACWSFYSNLPNLTVSLIVSIPVLLVAFLSTLSVVVGLGGCGQCVARLYG
jgi:hypothetical protein